MGRETALSGTEVLYKQSSEAGRVRCGDSLEDGTAEVTTCVMSRGDCAGREKAGVYPSQKNDRVV